VRGSAAARSAGARHLLAVGLAYCVAALCLAAVPGMAPGATMASAAPEDLEDHFARSWYYTEVIVFQRPAALEHLTDEALVTPARPLPRHLRAFETDRPLSVQYPLYPLTHAYLAFPYLNQQLLAPWQTATPWERPPGRELDGQSPARENDVRPGVRTATAGARPPDDADAGRDRAARRPPPAIDPVLAPDPLLDFLAALADFEAELAARSYRWLPADTLTLRGMADRLGRSNGYRLLLHGRWLQPVPARDAPEALLIEAGPPLAGMPPLQGSFDVTLGRYLHFNAHLYYTEPLLDRAPRGQAVPPPGLEIAAPSPLGARDLSSEGYMQLHQRRRLRSDEVHYLDHPKLGIIVKIEAIEPPEALRRAFDALEESQQ